VLEGFVSKEGAIVDFPGVGQQYFCKGAKSGKITFSPLKTKEMTFLQTCLPFNKYYGQSKRYNWHLANVSITTVIIFSA